MVLCRSSAAKVFPRERSFERNLSRNDCRDMSLEASLSPAASRAARSVSEDPASICHQGRDSPLRPLGRRPLPEKARRSSGPRPPGRASAAGTDGVDRDGRTSRTGPPLEAFRAVPPIRSPAHVVLRPRTPVGRLGATQAEDRPAPERAAWKRREPGEGGELSGRPAPDARAPQVCALFLGPSPPAVGWSGSGDTEAPTAPIRRPRGGRWLSDQLALEARTPNGPPPTPAW